MTGHVVGIAGHDQIGPGVCSRRGNVVYQAGNPRALCADTGMPAERIVMHKIRELLRLKYGCALSNERIARALSISKGVVAKYVKVVETANRESQNSWKDFLLRLKARGLAGVEFVVSDDHAGLKNVTAGCKLIRGRRGRKPGLVLCRKSKPSLPERVAAVGSARKATSC